MASALRTQEVRPAGPGAPGRGIDAVTFQNLPYGRRRDRNSEAGQFPRDPPIAPVLVVLGHAQHQVGDIAAGAWAPRLLTRGLRRPAPADEIAMPSQDRPRRDDQTQVAMDRPRDHRQQSREQSPVGPGQLRPSRGLSLQNGDLMPKKQDFRLFPRHRAPGQPQPRRDPDSE
jgi:hypothetical protein